MVPISAHALFARPLVVAPTSVLAVEVMARTDGSGDVVEGDVDHEEVEAGEEGRSSEQGDGQSLASALLAPDLHSQSVAC